MLYTSVQVANGHPCGNPHRKREEFMDTGIRTRELLPEGIGGVQPESSAQPNAGQERDEKQKSGDSDSGRRASHCNVLVD